MEARERRRHRRRKAHNKLLKRQRMKNQWAGGHGPDRSVGWGRIYTRKGKLQGGSWGWFGEWNIIGASFHADSTEARRPHLASCMDAVFAPAMPPIEPLLMYVRIYTRSCKYIYIYVYTYTHIYSCTRACCTHPLMRYTNTSSYFRVGLPLSCVYTYEISINARSLPSPVTGYVGVVGSYIS